MKTKPNIGDLIRRKHCPHVGIIIETRGTNVAVRWIRPFWYGDKRVEYSYFQRTEAEIISKA